MRAQTILRVLALPLAFVASAAQATPSLSWRWSGSYFFIDAKNDDYTSYHCSFEYTWAYDDFGQRQTKSTQGTFFVKAHWQGRVHENQGSWVRPELVGSPNIQCQ